MDQGKIIAYGTHDELIRLVGEQTHIDLTLSGEAGKVLDVWHTIEGVSSIDSRNGTVVVLVDDSNRVLPHLFETVSQTKVRINSVDIQEPNLEAVFLHLTGRALRD